MANKHFSELSSRNQSSLVSQLHKLISCYSAIFCTRKRVYLKKILTSSPECFYWMEGKRNELTATALVDPNYVVNVDGVVLHTIGHTLATISGQMDAILKRIILDYEGKSLMFLAKPFIAESVSLAEFGFLMITPLELKTLWPHLSELKTDYFNVSNEVLVGALDRKKHNLYLKLSTSDKDKLKKMGVNL